MADRQGYSTPRRISSIALGTRPSTYGMTITLYNKHPSQILLVFERLRIGFWPTE